MQELTSHSSSSTPFSSSIAANASEPSDQRATDADLVVPQHISVAIFSPHASAQICTKTVLNAYGMAPVV